MLILVVGAYSDGAYNGGGVYIKHSVLLYLYGKT